MRRFTAITAALIVLVATTALAQPRSGRLLVTVVDPSGGVIPEATVTVAGQDDATKKTSIAPVKTSDRGLATIEGLALGRYLVQAAFEGFDIGMLKDVRIRSGDNKHIVVLPLQKLTDTVTVGRDAQEAAADPRSRFGSALTREQIDALADDPDEMQRQLQAMAGPGAVLRIDSFEGGNLPPKAQIKAIHITRDAFAAENHSAGGVFIDIITQPGMGPWRGNVNLRLRDGSLSGRSPFTQTKGPEQIRNYGGNVGGSLIKQKASFSVSVFGTSSYETPNLNVALPNGTRRSEALSIRQPRDNFSAHSFFDYAVTRDQTIRASYSFNSGSQQNLGVGAYDLPERAYSSTDRFHYLRIQEAGPLGRRFFTNTRLQVNWSDSESRSALEAPTIRVNDAFTSGGQQVSGGRHRRGVNLASDLDYVRGIHSVRTGIVLDGGWHRSDDGSNYLGTYTFESLEAFEAGRARTYTRRIGDPTIRYFNLQAGVYVQDDIRVRKSLTFSPGLRYEIQTHLRDHGNIGPRFGVSWAPFKSGKTTLRTSWGIFYDWLAAGTYEQTLRVDGFRQQELNIVDPFYPDPGSIGLIPPINRYLLGGDTEMPRTMRISAGVDHRFGPRVRISGTYANARGVGLLRGRNLNLPVAGVRPDPEFGNVVEVVSDAQSRLHSLNVNGNVSLAAPSPPGTGPRFNWRRTSINASMFVGSSRNNTDGAFRFPPNGDLETEWGPAATDVRYRGSVGFNTTMLRNLSANLFLSASSGSPYTIRTGRDDNGDLEFNDRPAGVGRHSARGAGQMNLSGNFSYMIAFGGRTIALPPGIRITAGGGGPVTVETVAQPDAKRYRLTLNAQVQNLTNRKNYGGYSGIMTSPFFGVPTMVTGTRKVDVGMSFSF
jgi:hypothetical protein